MSERQFKTALMDESAVNRALIRITHEIVEKNKGCQDICLVGIHRRGVPIAHILRENLFHVDGVDVPIDMLDITMYRDDLSERPDLPQPHTPMVEDKPLSVDIQGKTDERNGRTDDDRRQELIDPCRTDKHHDDGDDRVNKTCDQGAEDNTAEAVCTGADQRADECKGRTEEDGRFAAGDENVAKRTDTGTEQCCGRVHIQRAAVAAVDECGDEQCRRDDCQ